MAATRSLTGILAPGATLVGLPLDTSSLVITTSSEEPTAVSWILAPGATATNIEFGTPFPGITASSEEPTALSVVNVPDSTVDGTTIFIAKTSTFGVAPSSSSSTDGATRTSGLVSPTSSAGGNGGTDTDGASSPSAQRNSTTTIIAIVVPICVVLITAALTAWYWHCRRRRSADQSNSRVIRMLSRKGTRRTSATGVEIHDSERKELDDTARPHELANTVGEKRDAKFQPSRRDNDAHLYANELEAASISGTSRNVLRKQRQEMQQQQSRQQAENAFVTPREYNQFEANLMANIINQADIDDELKALRIEQGRIQAERETAEQREAEIRRLIRMKEESGRRPSGDAGQRS